MNSLNISAIFSLTIQFITGILEGTGLTFKLDNKDKIVQDILLLELIVQCIEFLFYIYLVYLILHGHLTKSVTRHRYIDWIITTPTMLVSFILFFKYLRDPLRNIRILESAKEELLNIMKVVIGNAFMLFFGFLGEAGYLPNALGISLGFIPFAYVFKIIYAEYAKYTTLSKILFYISFTVWGLYGVSAALPFAEKNTMYNILDVIAKNLYGLFLYFFVRSKQI